MSHIFNYKRAAFRFLKYSLAIYLSYVVLEGVYNRIRNNDRNYWGTAMGIGIIYVLIVWNPTASGEKKGQIKVTATLELEASVRQHNNVLQDYGSYIERNPISFLEIRDVSRLPHPKESILDALRMRVLLCNTQQELASTFAVAEYLPQFQNGIGTQSLHRLGMDATDLNRLSQQDPIEAAKDIQNNSSAIERYEAWAEVVDAERTLILHKLRQDAAERKLMSGQN